ncbi:hypothetical protein [Flavobacterium sp.]|uniref:transmembrane-type terpene cyclase n=1 Tax=Flavobacterium sp. TaxID=239 RepID=UPI0031DF8F6C
MLHIFTLLGLIGGSCWIVAYILILYKGLRDKTYGMPLVPLVLNFSYEFVYSFCHPVNKMFNIPWFLLDLGIVYTYFKYGYPYFNKFYLIGKKEWYLVSMFTFISGFLITFFTNQFFSQNLTTITNDHISVILGFIWVIFIPICMTLMFFQRKSTEGQSFWISFLILAGTFSYIIQILYSPLFIDCVSPFLILLNVISIIMALYHTRLLYKKITKEGLNPWKTL